MNKKLRKELYAIREDMAAIVATLEAARERLDAVHCQELSAYQDTPPNLKQKKSAGRQWLNIVQLAGVSEMLDDMAGSMEEAGRILIEVQTSK